MTAPTLDRPDNWAAVEAARDGDREAFGVLWQAYQPRIMAYILRRVNGHATAEDLTDDVFVRALAGIDRIEWQGRDIGAWLVTIAHNLIADHYKSSRVRTTDLVPEFDDLDIPDPMDVAKLATDTPIGAMLWHAVAQLPPDQRDCIRLRYARGLSVAETAVKMGKNEGAIKALAYRACRALRRDLASAGLVEAVSAA